MNRLSDLIYKKEEEENNKEEEEEEDLTVKKTQKRKLLKSGQIIYYAKIMKMKITVTDLSQAIERFKIKSK